MNLFSRLFFKQKNAEDYYQEAYNYEIKYKEYEKALKLYLKAAELGLDKAQYYSGLMILNNRGCKMRNKKEAIELIEKAANQNYPHAQLLMSKIYHNGEFTKQNIELGDDWLNKYNSHNLEKPIIISFHGY